MILTTLALVGFGVATWKSYQKKEQELLSKNRASQKNPLSKSTPTKQEILPQQIEETTHYQKASLLSLSLTSVASFLYPPVALAVAPVIGYIFYPLVESTYHTIKKKKVALAIFEFVSVAGLLVTGHYLIASLSFFMYFTARRLILQTQRDTHIDFSQIFGSLPKKVWVEKGDIELEIPLEKVETGDIVVVHSGEIIPVDGVVIKGEGTIDEQMLTGESKSLEKESGDTVFTSTCLLSGRLHIKVTKKGEDSITGQIAQILDKSAEFKTQVESKGDKIVDKGATLTILGSAITYPILGLTPALALTYSGFGYQMRLSAPLMVLNYLKVSSQRGILIKDGRALETLLDVDVVIFDKTGTLTKETPEITQIISFSGFTSQKLLQFAASAEKRQKHPIAQAILEKAKEDSITLLDIKESSYEMGYGIGVVLKDRKAKKILLGSQRFMELSNIKITIQLKDLQEQCIKKGNSLVYIADEKRLLGVIELSTKIRPEAFEMVKELYAMNKELYIISGDQAEPTKYLANEVGIKNYYAQTLPQDKAKIVEELQKEGKKVCFIGDGINDTVVLQKADVSVSLHGASTIAMDVADILLIKPNLLALPYLFKMSKELHEKLDNTMYLNNIISSTSVGSILFLGMGYTGAVLFYYASMGASVGYSFSPLLEEKKRVANKLIKEKNITIKSYNK